MHAPPREAKLEVAVAVATYRRPHRLESLLPVLTSQVLESPENARLIIVDNDPDAGASEVMRKWRGSRVHYVHEARPGLASARNRALDEARTADLLVFIDDDEIPELDWLTNLTTAWRSWRCAAIVGPVEPVFEGRPNPWTEFSGVFRPTKRPTGTRLSGGASNNLLLNLQDLRRLNLRFDSGFGLSGGEDTRLMHELIRRGGVVRWCAEARVREAVPADRMTRRWVVERRLRTSNSWSRVALDLASSPRDRARIRVDLTARALARLARGGTRAGLGVARASSQARVEGVIEMVNSVGMLLGTYGVVVSGYARTSS